MEYKKFVLIPLNLYQHRIAPSSDPRRFILDSDNLQEKTKLLSTISRPKQTSATTKNQKVLSTNEAQTDLQERDEEKGIKTSEEQLIESVLNEAGGSAIARNRNKLILEKFLINRNFSLSDSGTIIHKGSDTNHPISTFLNHLQHISRKLGSIPETTRQILTRLSHPPHLVTNVHLQNFLQSHITKQQFSLAYSTPGKSEKFDFQTLPKSKSESTETGYVQTWFGFDH